MGPRGARPSLPVRREGHGGPARPGAPRIASARERAAALLAAQLRKFPDFEIAQLDTAGLDARDAALAHAIYDLVLRRWITLHHLIQPLMDMPMEETPHKAVAPLLCGAAQILFMDRIPARAAVDEAVELAKLGAGVRAGGMVNAVLRRFIDEFGEGSSLERRDKWNAARDELPLADGRALVLPRQVLSKDPMSLISVATSHPIELLRSWSRTMSMREVRRLAHHGVADPPTILNTMFATTGLPLRRPEAPTEAAGGVAAGDPKERGSKLRATVVAAPQIDYGYGLTPHKLPGHHVWSGPHDQLAAMLRSRRDVWVQDPASSLGVASVADLKPGLVLDLCAGMGTKTRQLAATFPNAKIITTDVDLPRFKTLQQVFKGNEQVTAVPYASLIDYAGKADLILLDVPCSNTGVLARRVEARYRFDRTRLDKLAGIQKQIIADSIPLLNRSGKGQILYSTCSLDPAENEQQARWAAQWHQFKVTREHRRLPEGGPGEPDEQYTDGSYAVLLQ